jgi:hypothetical protein
MKGALQDAAVGENFIHLPEETDEDLGAVDLNVIKIYLTSAVRALESTTP